MNKHPHYKRSGFTLIELLVVISIILIASSVIFIGGTGGDGAKLTSAQRVLSGIAQGARGQAILKGSRVRLIIYDDAASNEDDEKKLRYFGLIYQNPENDNQWIAATQGSFLPEGIYFNKDLSDNNGWSSSKTMKIEYPRSVPKALGNGETFNYYEFNANGTVPNEFANDWIVLQAGTLKPSPSGALEVDFTDENKQGLKAALILRRAGSVTPVTDPSEIN